MDYMQGLQALDQKQRPQPVPTCTSIHLISNLTRFGGSISLELSGVPNRLDQQDIVQVTSWTEVLSRMHQSRPMGILFVTAPPTRTHLQIKSEVTAYSFSLFTETAENVRT